MAGTIEWWEEGMSDFVYYLQENKCPLQTAVDCNAASIMPYYAKPAKEKSEPQILSDDERIEMEPYGVCISPNDAPVIIMNMVLDFVIRSRQQEQRSMTWQWGEYIAVFTL